jgi:AcrR family transcriptional regulator
MVSTNESIYDSSKALLSPTQLRKIWDISNQEQRSTIIVDVALHLLEKHGVEYASMRKIASAIGVGTMTLYSYIKSQDELFLRIAGRGIQMLSAHMHEAWDASKNEDILIQSEHGLKSYIDFSRAHSALYEVMFRQPMSMSKSDEGFGRFLNYYKELSNMTERLLNAEGYTEEEARNLAFNETALRWAFMHGLALLYNAGRLDSIGQKPEKLVEFMYQRTFPSLFSKRPQPAPK